MKLSVAAAILFSNSVSAHSIFQTLWVNGVSQGHEVGIRVPDYDGPITDVTSNDLICNGGINPYHQPVSTTIIPVPAGAQVTAEWHHGLDTAGTNDPADPIDSSHKGPILAYMAKVSNATQTDVTGLKWFKIFHDGLDGTTWAVDKMIAAQGKVTFTIPSCIPAGQYLLRVELIALHGAQVYPGAQFYMECAQIQVTGGGSASPATVSIPGLYKGTDPGVTVDIYNNLSSYTIPGMYNYQVGAVSRTNDNCTGPSVFSCGGSTAPASTSTVASTTSKTTTVSSTSKPATTTSTTTVPSSTATVAHYGQCGGQTYTGPTVCASPYTCVVSNAYYSQCL